MRRTAGLALALSLLLALAAERAALEAEIPARSDRVVSYSIRARLDPALKEVQGDLDLVWRNTSGLPVDEIYLHLYLNAFRDRESTFMREGNEEGKAGSRFDEEHPGSIRIEKLRTADGTDLLPAALSFVQPDDGNPRDETLARVKLGAPVAPQETVSLGIAFRSRLPRVVARTGWSGDPDDPDSLFFMVAQWYPKVAVLRQDAAGALLWNAHQYHRNTEFFADYGEYRVAITVPAGYRVGATGRAASDPVRNEDGTETTTYVQEDVHDFAWTASPHFRAADFTWTFDGFCDAEPKLGLKLRQLLARTAEHLGVEASAIRPANPVAVRILHQPDHEGMVERIYRAAGAALACYGLWFGPYPYATLTIVDPPAGGAAAGGMEYPTLITIFTDRHAPDYAMGLEAVTIHEFGHQFFYGLVGSNEFEEAWLDEGFTSFTDARVHEVAYGAESAFTRYGPVYTPFFRPFAAPNLFSRLRAHLQVDGLLDALPRPWKRPESLLPVPEESPFWDYLRDFPPLHFDARVPLPQPFGDRNGFLRSGTHDSMVLPGWEFAARSDYRANSYPKPSIFLYCLRGLMGEPAFDRALRAYAERHRFGHPRTEDFLSVMRGHGGENAEVLGAFLEAMIETAARFDAAILDVAQRKLPGEGPERWEWTIRVQRRGTVELPIELRVEDGAGAEELLETWASRGGETSRTFRVVRDRPMRAARLGPGWLAFLDADLANNARRVEADPIPAATLAARFTLYVEEVVRSYAGVAR